MTIKYRKKSEWEWRADLPNGYSVQIDKVSGNAGFPFMWAVMPPRPEGLVRWVPIAKGSERKLADAKAKIERQTS